MNTPLYLLALHLLKSLTHDESSVNGFEMGEMLILFTCFVDALEEAGTRDLDIDNYFEGNYVKTILEAGKVQCMVEFSASGEMSPHNLRPELVTFLTQHCTDIKWVLLHYRPLTQWVSTWQQRNN